MPTTVLPTTRTTSTRLSLRSPVCAVLFLLLHFLIWSRFSEYPQVRVVAVVEPDSLANIVTNLNVPKCAGAQAAYIEGVTYALQKLNTVGVYSYVDAGHAGWLGWPANLGPAAQLFANLYANAGSPPFFRGLATNVANYNLLNAPSPDPVTSPNPNYDEIHYINVSRCCIPVIYLARSLIIQSLGPCS